MKPAGAFFYDDELELEKEFMTVVNAINGPESEQTMRFYPLIKRLKPEDGSVTMQEHGESTHPRTLFQITRTYFRFQPAIS